MTREEAIEILKFERGYFCDLKGCQEHQAFTMAIKALEQEPCEDAISRQAVIDTCLNTFFNGYKEKDLLHDIKKLPSVRPQEPKTGRWEWVQYDANPEIGNFHCSECRYIPASFNMSAQKLNYCPKCGAKMQ